MNATSVEGLLHCMRPRLLSLDMGMLFSFYYPTAYIASENTSSHDMEVVIKMELLYFGRDVDFDYVENYIEFLVVLLLSKCYKLRFYEIVTIYYAFL